MVKRAQILIVIICCCVVETPNTHAQNPDYFVRAFVDLQTPLLGQQITYHFQFYTAVVLPEAIYEPPDFAGFWRTDVSPARQSVGQVNGRQYTIKELTTTLFPNKLGEIRIEPSDLILFATVFRDEETLRTEEVIVTVQPLPDSPENFSGAVGTLALRATLDRQSITLDELINLNLTVSGSANLEILALPSLPIPAGWRVLPEGLNYRVLSQDDQLIGETTFTWSLLPSLPGEYELAPLTLTYFDTSIGQFKILSTIAVPITVLPGVAPLGETSADRNLSSNGIALRPLKSVQVTSTGSGQIPAAVALLLWLVPPVFLVLAGIARIVVNRRERRKDDRRASMALKTAMGTLKTKGARIAIEQYFRDRTGKQTGGWALSEYVSAMQTHNISVNTRTQVTGVLEYVDMVRYSASATGSSGNLAMKTAEILTMLDTEWATNA